MGDNGDCTAVLKASLQALDLDPAGEGDSNKTASTDTSASPDPNRRTDKLKRPVPADIPWNHEGTATAARQLLDMLNQDPHRFRDRDGDCAEDWLAGLEDEEAACDADDPEVGHFEPEDDTNHDAHEEHVDGQAAGGPVREDGRQERNAEQHFVFERSEFSFSLHMTNYTHQHSTTQHQHLQRNLCSSAALYVTQEHGAEQ